MTIVLVHGNPETDAVWGPLVSALERRGVTDVVRLSPPGFGAPLPADFGATMDEYRDWLIGELAAFGEPVDLVGHDWGGGHVVNVAMSRPDLLRSWVSDSVGLFDRDYVWHDHAQAWQTPEVGEQAVAAVVGVSLEERTKAMIGLGMTDDVAAEVARDQDDAMGRAILALYRDAAQPAMARRGEHLPEAAARPGLALLATADHFVGTEEMRRRAATAAGAEVVELDGLGHWWMLEDPDRGADALTRFWAR